MITTVLGPVPVAELGHVQPHEHLLADLGGYAPDGARHDPIELGNYYRSRVDRDNAHDLVLDDVTVACHEVGAYRESGGGTLVDVTPEGLGRKPSELRRISRTTGVHIVMGSGYYTASFHPPAVAAMSVAAVEERITADLQEGVDGVRAGVIGEIGMSWPPHPDETKVLRGAAKAQSRTGAALYIHPGRHRSAPAAHLHEALETGADPRSTILCHIDRTLFDDDEVLALARTGCMLEFDLFGTESSYYPPNPGIDLPNDGMRVRRLRTLVEAGHADQLLISSDICRKTQLRHHGGEGYDHILRRVLPLMAARGIAPEHIAMITRDNPAQVLSTEGKP